MTEPKRRGRPPKHSYALEAIQPATPRVEAPQIQTILANVDEMSTSTRPTRLVGKLPTGGKTAFVQSLMPGGRRHHIVEEATKCRTKSQRIEFIVALISSGSWRTALSRPLADVWGVSSPSMSQMTSEANRYVTGALGDREQIRAKCIAMLETIAADAIEVGDGKTAVSAIRTVSEIFGLVVTKHEHTGANGGPIQYQDLSKLSEEELEAAIVKAAANAVRARSGLPESTQTTDTQLVLAGEVQIIRDSQIDDESYEPPSDVVDAEIEET